MRIKYESIDFPTHLGVKFSGHNELQFNFQELVWSAITVGRENSTHVLQFGIYSEYELIYRLTMLLANLKLDGNYIVKSNAYKNLDPSEKSAISYFLGLTFTKLFAYKLLSINWLLHVDLYSTALTSRGTPIKFAPSRSRPDLIGLDTQQRWNVFESKGRTNTSSLDLRNKAKAQTRKLRNIGGLYPNLRIGCITFFKNNQLQFEWIDPEGYDEDAFDIETTQQEFLNKYYQNLKNLINISEIESVIENYQSLSYGRFHLEIGLHNRIMENDLSNISTLNELNFNIDNLPENTTLFPDGFFVKCENLFDRMNNENINE